MVLIVVAACSGPDPAIVSTTVLGSTHDTTGPYRVDTIVTGTDVDDVVDLMVAIDTTNESRFFPTVMDSDGERFAATIGGQPTGTEVFYFIRVVRDGELVVRDPASELAPAYGFQVLRPDGACQVDSECALGAETCRDDVCTPLPGVCANADDCPAGYACDVETGTCGPRPRSCADDLDCPTSDECDTATRTCTPRHLCSATLACPDGYTCNVALGRCFST